MSYQGQTDSDLDNLIMIDTNQDYNVTNRLSILYLFLKKAEHVTGWGKEKSQSLYFWTN